MQYIIASFILIAKNTPTSKVAKVGDELVTVDKKELGLTA